MTGPPAIQQISLSLSAERNAVVPATAASSARRERDYKNIVSADLKATDGHGLTFDLHLRHSPFHICVSEYFSQQVIDLHRILDKALVSVIERWFGDKRANFPERMPLEKHEEDLLRWIDGQRSDLVPRFGEKYGMWRTDYLIEKGADGFVQAQICEINSRIPYNGFWVVGLHEEATKFSPLKGNGFRSPNDFNVTQQAVIDCFDPTQPLFHISSKWPGVDSRPMSREYGRRTGHLMHMIEPTELHLRASDVSATGYQLFYDPKDAQNGELAGSQEVHQCSLELFQEEYAGMDPLLLRQIATCCVNDIRNVFIVHDKRSLGILLEELSDLEGRGFLTPEEAEALRNGLPETLIPGTQTMKDLLKRSQIDETQKNRYIIKPVRDAMGNGIKLGSQISQEEWISVLEQQAARPLRPNEGACVVQRLVDHILYDIIPHEPLGKMTGRAEKFHLIGSQHMINSKLCVSGPWRIGQDKHIGIRGEAKGIVSSCVLRPEGMGVDDTKEEEEEPQDGDE